MEELPEYATLIPLPYKISFLICLGTFGWYAIVYANYKYFHLNTLRLISLSYLKHNYAQLDGRVSDDGEHAATVPADFKENLQLLQGLWKNVYRLFLVTTGSLLVFHLLSWNGALNVLTPIAKLLPPLTIIYCIHGISKPVKGSVGCRRFSTTLKRILVGGIASRTMRTNDILISDTLVSYARVLNDFVLYVWSSLVDDTVYPYNIHVESLVLAFPILVRIKQCWYEYKITGSRQHLLNLLKYSTGLGPMLVNILVRATLNDSTLNKEQVLLRVAQLNRWWYLLATINSTYSFVWDIKMDWGLSYFTNGGLRPRAKLIGHPIKYYIIILVDFVLRFLWVFKIFQKSGEIVNDHYFAIVGGFLFGGNAYSFGFTVIEILEIIRRWMWCFIKLENDWFKLDTQAVELDLVKES